MFILDDVPAAELTDLLEQRMFREIEHQSMTAMPGRKWVICSLARVALCLAFAPVVFGPLGVATDGVAVAKGVSNKCG